MKHPFKALAFRFSPFGALLVAAQSLPNVLWALFPPDLNRLDGNASSILFIEYGEHILGVAIVILMVLLVNTARTEKLLSGWAIAAYAVVALYWVCWVFYFAEIQPNLVIYAMVVLPPVAFALAGINKGVWPISLAAALFLVFHLLVALENFPLGG